MSKTYHYLFGPVPSRRLGRSLGIDVTPQKACSFDCLFCQCGDTEKCTAERAEYVPYTKVCDEVERWLAEDGQADVITFAGSGEPTLYNRLGDLISFIKERTDIPVILLSNGTLLHRPEVRAEAAKADVVKISLSAWDEASFQRANRPAAGLSFEGLLEGERAFRSEFSGKLWLEIFLMEGINAEPEQVQRIAALANSLGAETIHLNTAVRPPADAAAQPVAQERLESYREFFKPTAEVIASFTANPPAGTPQGTPTNWLDLIRRHPATAAQLAAMTGTDLHAVERALAPLLASGSLQVEERGGESYYK
jgi:wyosine [tRNA(Phe)-imidazoG37] synthetase (radical SAM superfamily)